MTDFVQEIVGRLVVLLRKGFLQTVAHLQEFLDHAGKRFVAVIFLVIDTFVVVVGMILVIMIVVSGRRFALRLVATGDGQASDG